MGDNQPGADEVNTLTKHTATLSLQNSSPLLDLAAEIRLKILEYALPPVGREYRVCEDPSHSNHAALEQDWNCVRHLSKHCPGILLVNHQIYTESLEFVHGVQKFSFCCLPCLRRFLQNVNRLHLRQISKLSCQHRTIFHPTFSPGERQQEAILYFVDSAMSAVSQYMTSAFWKQSLVFAVVQNPAILRVNWILTLSKQPESAMGQPHKNDGVACFVFAAAGKEFAEVPVTDTETMGLLKDNVRVLLALKDQLGDLRPVVRSITPEWIRGYVVP